MTFKIKSLNTSVILTLCVGLLIPAVLGGTLIAALRQREMSKMQDSSLNEKVKQIADSLVTPVWNLDNAAAKTIVDAALIDPKVIRIAVHMTDADSFGKAPLYVAEISGRRVSDSRVVEYPVKLGAQTIGNLAIEIDGDLEQRLYIQDHRAYIIASLAQFIFALIITLIAIRRYVLKPLAQLTEFSSQLANGNLDKPLSWTRSNEIGTLGRQMDKMRSQLKNSFAEKNTILNSIQVGVLFVRNRHIEMANKQAERIFGYDAGMMLNLPTRIIYQSDDQYTAVGERAYSAIGSTGTYDEELRLQGSNAIPFWASMRGSSMDEIEGGSIWVFEDITNRKIAEEEINTLAFYDSLTGLPNRRLLLERLKRAVIAIHRDDSDGALLFIDLDNFKTLNDSLGHDIGDLLLKQVAERLLAVVRAEDSVARLGGDEFVVLLESLSSDSTEAASQAQIVAETIMEALLKIYVLNGYQHKCTASIGITLFRNSNGNDSSIDDLFKQADLALYQAKGAGRNTLRFFDPKMQDVVSTRIAMDADLQQAIVDNQFHIYLQPQVNAAGRTIGAEALIRWIHPSKGMIPPAEFIPFAEENGHILAIGNWVLEQACQLLALWSTISEFSHLPLAVNVSARQFGQSDFVENVLSIIDRCKAPAHLLKIELTESLLLLNPVAVIEKMVTLRSSSITFSLDDFGTGYSSLSYLKRLPLDQLKIDQSFVQDIMGNSNDEAIAKTVIALADSLGLSVIAEGVETVEQKKLLLQHGCNVYQGYYFSRPLSIDGFIDYVRTMNVNLEKIN